MRCKKSKANDPLWITSTLSSLSSNQQKALNQGNIDECKRLRNHVSRKRKSCRARYYESSIQHLKQSKPNLWEEVKRLCDMEVNDKNTDKIVKALRPDEKLSSTTKEALANEIKNYTFLSPMSIFEPPY